MRKAPIRRRVAGSYARLVDGDKNISSCGLEKQRASSGMRNQSLSEWNLHGLNCRLSVDMRKFEQEPEGMANLFLPAQTIESTGA